MAEKLKELTNEIKLEIRLKIMKNRDSSQDIIDGKDEDYSGYEGIGQYVQTVLALLEQSDQLTHDWAY